MTEASSVRRRCSVGGSDARIIIGDDQGTLRRPSGNMVVHAPKIALNPVVAAHAEFVADLGGRSPGSIPVDARPVDLEGQANHLTSVLNALSVYVCAILDDIPPNVLGRLNRRPIDAPLSPLASDITGSVRRAADAMAGRVA